MKTSADERPDSPSASLPRVPWRWFLPLLALLAGAIVLMTWPWAKTFASGVIAHWDPPFHAWKLEFAARQILEGRLLPVDGNTNMYYPHSGAFYYEALHWPQAVFAALLLLAGAEPVLVYHVTLVFFWALSGACFWALLRALGVSSAAAFVGALLFTLMPYRIVYRVEFNMQLCFAIPLFFFFFVRYFQRPCVFYACGAAVAWWLQATSELYQAVFLLLLLPFPILAALSGHWRLTRSLRAFWLPTAVAALLGGALSFVWLAPYGVLLESNTLSRGLDEIRRHVLEPLSYLVPYDCAGFFEWVKARHDEMNAYPTLAVMVLAAIHLAGGLAALRRGDVPKGERILRLARAVALLLFCAMTALLYASVGRGLFAPVYSLLPVLICLFSVPLVMSRRERDVRGALMEGLFAAAIFAFFLSLGPDLLGTASGFAAPNPLFRWLYEHLDALRGFRVVSRFSFFVLFWMVLAAALALDRLLKEPRRDRRVAILVALGALGLAFVHESVPRRNREILPLPCPLESQVLENLDRREDPYVLAIVPLGCRDEDSQHMLQVARHDRLSIYAWGGTYPLYTQRVNQAFKRSSGVDAREAAGLLRQLWPECLMLEDKRFSRMNARPVDYAARFAAEATVVDEDARFALLRLAPDETPAAEHVRLVRHDLLVRNPQVSFTAFAPDAPGSLDVRTVWLDLNGRVVGRWEIDAEPRTFRLALPRELAIHPLPNRLRFFIEANKRFVLRDFRLEPADGTAPSADPGIACFPPWVGMVESPPVVGSVRLDAAYRGGLELLGVEQPISVIRPGDVLHMRYYARLPSSVRALSRFSLKTGFTRDGNVVFESGGGVAELIDANLFWTKPRGVVYKVDMPVVVPADFPPGETFGLALTVRDGHGKRRSGRDSEGRRVRRLHLPFAVSIVAD